MNSEKKTPAQLPSPTIGLHLHDSQVPLGGFLCLIEQREMTYYKFILGHIYLNAYPPALPQLAFICIQNLPPFLFLSPSPASL